MELIGDLEPVPRGVYTGAIGFFADGGDAVFSVGIRTLSVHQGVGHLHVGCGIVADSVPSMELDESKWKAAAIARTLGTETEWAGLKGVGR
jgi:para-aminobenzoate synthetase component 1